MGHREGPKLRNNRSQPDDILLGVLSRVSSHEVAQKSLSVQQQKRGSIDFLPMKKTIVKIKAYNSNTGSLRGHGR